MPDECSLYADAKGAVGMGEWNSNRLSPTFDACLDVFCLGNATVCTSTPASRADLDWLLLLSTNSDALKSVEGKLTSLLRQSVGLHCTLLLHRCCCCQL
jgi:hypothetical protein